MTPPSADRPRVVVPLAVLAGATVSPGLIDLLGTVDVTVLGYHVLPEQTAPDQARMQYEERANAALADVTAEFESAGGAADYRLVFTHDRTQTVRRVASELDAEAFAVTGATGPVEQLLVPVTGDVAVDRITDFVATLVADRDIGVTLFLATGEDEAATDEGRAALDEAAAPLRESGLDVRTELATGGPFEALVDAATGHDAIVMGEQAPSLRSFLFGEEGERVATETVGPVLVVRRPAAVEPADVESDEAETEPDGSE